ATAAARQMRRRGALRSRLAASILILNSEPQCTLLTVIHNGHKVAAARPALAAEHVHQYLIQHGGAATTIEKETWAALAARKGWSRIGSRCSRRPFGWWQGRPKQASRCFSSTLAPAGPPRYSLRRRKAHARPNTDRQAGSLGPLRTGGRVCRCRRDPSRLGDAELRGDDGRDNAAAAAGASHGGPGHARRVAA